MNFLTVITVIIGIIVIYKIIAAFIHKRNKEFALSLPFPNTWILILKNNLPPYKYLSPHIQNELHENIQHFIFEKNFEGCGGLTLTDEMKVTIAAQASILLLNRRIKCYPKLHTVLVYPSTYIAGTKSILGNHEKPSARLGESWNTGTVVLAWDSVKGGALNFMDGRNVTMHEFAHQLDQEDGSILYDD